LADSVKAAPGGERLDIYLVRSRLAGSRRAARELIAAGRVRVNGRRWRKGRDVSPGDVVEVEPQATGAALTPDFNLPLEVLYHDDDLVVINKPGLLPCHPLGPDDRPTLMNAVVAHFPQAAHAGNKPLEGGLVHRLDNGTSGAIMVALNRASFARLRKALKSNQIARRYLAMVQGSLRHPLQFDAPIAHHLRNRRKMTAVHDPRAAVKLKARPASTAVAPLRNLNGFSLVEVTPRSGSRHQIRVHLADASFPIAGDELYGGPPMAPLAPGRFFLHLEQLSIPRDTGREILPVTAPLPDDLQRCVEALIR
jgi:23S rRNA pseudouridine1911/1915/1917 synthase